MPRRKIDSTLPPLSPALPEEKCRAGIPVPASLGGQIRFFREQHRLEQKELAARIGITANAISNWEHGRGRPDLNLLPALCQALNITLYELFGLQEPASFYTAEEQSLLAKYRTLTRGHQTALRQLAESLLKAQTPETVPILKKLIFWDRPLSAGPGDPSEWEAAGSPIYLYASRQAEQADYVFPVNGDSMEPKYHDGDRVLVARLDRTDNLPFGETGAFMAGNETYIKICEADGLHSLNPAYAPLTFSEETPVFLIGRVIGRLDPGQIAGEEEVARYLAREEQIPSAISGR